MAHSPMSPPLNALGKLKQLENTGLEKLPRDFSIISLYSAIQNGVNLDELRACIQQYKDGILVFSESFKLHAWPALFYAVASINTGYLDLHLEFGADPEKTGCLPGAGCMPLPLMAFAIINRSENATDSSDIVARLLCASVNLKSVPEDLWVDRPVALDALAVEDSRVWCTPDVRERLAAAITVTHCYLFRRASETSVLNERTIQIATGNKASSLLNIGHSIVGQQTACSRVLDIVFAHVAMKREEPLLLAFAGPPGHGKAELAERIGDMISAKSVSINCAEVSSSWGLFGSEPGYHADSNGAILNNFLMENDGKVSIVFLDELDKTRQEVIDSLLRVYEKGKCLKPPT
jgi:hypothetical protein